MARTFIQPGQELRKHGLRMKFNPLPEIVEGQRLVVVDDSIVRGNTTRQIVGMLRDAGAAEVHLRISAPPIRFPAITASTCRAARRWSLTSGPSTRSPSTSAPTRSPTSPSTASTRRSAPRAEDHCDACFTGRYPLGENSNGKFALEQLTTVPAGTP